MLFCRYSLTYIPLADRQTSLDDINMHLKYIADKSKKAFKGMHIVPNFSICKLLCEYRGKQVKIEVNQTKRGIVGGEVQIVPLNENVQEEFSLFCEANVVPLTQLYGGKITTALSRQHPRDLFDVKYIDITDNFKAIGFNFVEINYILRCYREEKKWQELDIIKNGKILAFHNLITMTHQFQQSII